MDDTEIKAALARANKATPGPWIGRQPGLIPTKTLGEARANAEFIEHARTDLPVIAEECLRRGQERDEALGAAILDKAALKAAKDDALSLREEREDYRAEVARLIRERDGAHAILADAAAAFAAGDMERVRLDLCDRYARTRAYTLNAEREAELARLRAELADARSYRISVDLADPAEASRTVAVETKPCPKCNHD